MAITGVTTYFPLTYVSIAYDTGSAFYVAFIQNNTTLSRVDIYTTNLGPTGTYIACNLAGNTAYAPVCCWTDIYANPSIIYIPSGSLQAYDISQGTSVAITYTSNGCLQGVGNLRQVKNNWNGSFVQITTSSGIYQSQSGGALGTYTKVGTSSVWSAHSSKNGNILAYSSGSAPFALYTSNNQYTSVIGSTPSYTSETTPSGQVKDVFVSGNGLKIFFTITSQLDKIFQITLQGVLNSYQSDFIVDKDRQIIRSHLGMDILGTFQDVLLKNRITQIGQSTTLTLPFYENYQLNGTTAFTVTLPAITEYMIGVRINMFHTGAKTVTINTNTLDHIITPIAAISLTLTTYGYAPAANYNAIGLMATYSPSSAKQFCWIVL
jgi:hypothetical protein